MVCGTQSCIPAELRAVKHFVPHKSIGIEIRTCSGMFADLLGIRIGVEPAETMRKLAKEKGLEVCDGVAEHLPFPDGRFDFALMVTTICFVDDIELTLQEIFRILKTNGCVILGFVDRAGPLGRSYEKHKDNNVFYHEAVFYSTEEVMNHLESNRFRVVDVLQTVFGSLSEITEPQDFKEGHGEGGFVVIKAVKLDVGQ